MSAEKRPPPNDPRAEHAVLGAVALRGVVAMQRARLVGLEAAAFFAPTHAAVWRAAEEVEASGRAVDTVTLAERLMAQSACTPPADGWAVFVGNLMDDLPSAEHVEHYARIVHEHAVLRRLMSWSAEVYRGAESVPPAAEYTAGRLAELAEIARSVVTDVSRTSLKDGLKCVISDLIAVRQGTPGIKPLATGFADLDDVLGGGLRAPRIAVIGARPGMGKTSAGLNIAVNVASSAGTPVLFVELEMGVAELCIRVLASDARVDSTVIESGALNSPDFQALTARATELMPMPIDFAGRPNWSIVEIRGAAQRWAEDRAREAKVPRLESGLIVIDYLQKVRASKRMRSREEEVAEISRECKAMAMDLNLPVLVLAQLNRDIEKRTDARPQLSDLRESGAIEMDADVVAFLHRDKKADPRTAELVVRKNRGGRLDSIELAWMPEFTRFESLSDRRNDAEERI